MSAKDVSDSLTELLSSVRARREEIEQARQLPADLAAALAGTGIFGLGIPRAIGGIEAEPADLMSTIETVAAADGSTGWCTMVGIANNVSAGYMGEEGAREVWADPKRPTAGIAAPIGRAVRVENGVRVDGRWPFASGITHSDWVWAGCMVMEDGHPRMTEHGPEMVHVCLPVSEVTIHDTWHVSGLRGTGSHDFSVSGAFVPERRIFALLDPAGHRAEPLYQMPPLSLFVLQLACVGLGIARAALDELAELALTKAPSLYMEPLAERPAMQVELARAEAALGGARSFLHAVAEEMWRTVRDGATPSARQLALVRAASIQAVEVAAAVSRSANTLAGGVSLFNSSTLQRHARDAEAMTHHFTVAPFVWEQAGRVLLGREPGVPVV